MSHAGPTVGVVGGGQLARMLAEAASPMGVRIAVLAAEADEGATEVVTDVTRGAPDDPAALASFAQRVDVLTIDHENVHHPTLARLESEGFAIRPSVHTLGFSDKAHQRREFSAAGIPVPDFEVVDPGAPDVAGRLSAFASAHGDALVAKASRGGYDGRGVWMLATADVQAFVADYDGAPLVLEPQLDLEGELAVLVARTPSGEVRTWPVLETIQVDGMCDEVIHPAPVSSRLADEARAIASEVAALTEAVGVLAVELFVVGGELLVNEIAPRVHNSGHLSIEAFATSQFEQHLRAVLDWPLGPTDPVAEVAVMANVVGRDGFEPRDRQRTALAEVPEAAIHLYGKSPRERRKVGHVTVLGTDRTTVRRRAARAASLLAGEPPVVSGVR